MLDNRDSFVYNLVHRLAEAGEEAVVYRSDEVSAAWVCESGAKAIVLSPGPGHPERAGCSLEVVRQARVPVLGICLGFQAVCAAYGGAVYPCGARHGKPSRVELDLDSPLFKNLATHVEAGRYHSLGVSAKQVSAPLQVVAHCNGLAMAVQDTGRNVFGVQFHPESVLTAEGLAILKNFVAIVNRTTAR